MTDRLDAKFDSLDEREMRIVRMTAARTAVAALGLLPQPPGQEEVWAEIQTATERLILFYLYGERLDD